MQIAMSPDPVKLLVNTLREFAGEVLAEAADQFEKRATHELALSADAELGHTSRHHARRSQAFTIAAGELRLPVKQAVKEVVHG